MKTKVEGLILAKTPQGERNLVIKLLLRNGKAISAMFYGGRGGGTKKKASVLELGTMLKVELAQSRSTSDMYSAKEWDVIWMSESIRNNHIAFYVMCFYLQVAVKISPEANLHDDTHDFDQHLEGLFRVLSNALVHLDSVTAAQTIDAQFCTSSFLSKLLVQLGVFPDLLSCMVCGVNLEQAPSMVLSAEHGGYVCSVCMHSDQDQKPLLFLMRECASKRYQDLAPMPGLQRFHLQGLFEYFCYQMQLNPKDFKTLAMIP